MMERDGNQSPMENSVILQQLFRFCGAKDLANCRLVSKRWYQDSMMSWRKVIPITISRNKDDHGRLFYLLHGKGESEKCYMDDSEVTEELCSKAYRNVKLESFFISLEKVPFLGFWNGPGKNLSTLHFHKCLFMHPDTDIMKILHEACPNLHTLKLEQCTTRVTRAYGAIPVFKRSRDGRPGYWGMGGDIPKSAIGKLSYQGPLFGINRNLKTLRVSGSVRRPASWLNLLSTFQSLTSVSVQDDNDLVGFIDAIYAVRKHDPCALPLTSISFEGVSEIVKVEGVARVVQQCRLPFISLHISVDKYMVQSEQCRLKILLHSLSSPLREIRMKSSSCLSSSSVSFRKPFPFGLKLDNLQHMDIDENLCETLAFLQFTPALEKLLVYVRGFSKKLIPNTRKLPNMQNLRMAHLVKFRVVSNLEVDEQDLASLLKWMPNLTSLEGLRVNDTQFGMICGNWSNLKTLAVYGSELTDYGIAGIRRMPGQSVRKMAKVTAPNLTNLQDLEEFSFWTDEITEVAVFHGFLQLPKLKKIKCCSDHLDWTDEAKQVLEKRGILLTAWTS